jgi:hypothetical protein
LNPSGFSIDFNKYDSLVQGCIEYWLPVVGAIGEIPFQRVVAFIRGIYLQFIAIIGSYPVGNLSRVSGLSVYIRKLHILCMGTCGFAGTNFQG